MSVLEASQVKSLILIDGHTTNLFSSSNISFINISRDSIICLQSQIKSSSSIRLMETKLIPQQYTAFAKEALKRLKELETSSKWQPNGNESCAMFKCQINERVASKGVAKTNYSFEKVIDFLEMEGSLKKINPMLLDIKVLENNQSYRISYMQYKGTWPVDNREFVSVAGRERTPTKMYIATTACPYPYPVLEQVVRGQVFAGGYIIEKLGQNLTQITYISDADIKGSVPVVIKNSLSAKQGELAGKVGPAMENEGIK